MNNIMFIIAKIMRKLHVPMGICRKYNRLRHTRILDKLTCYFEETKRKINLLQVDNQVEEYGEKIIWCFWWQGEFEMPLLVKKCYDSLLKNANGYRVVLLTKNNVRDYAKINDNIYKLLDLSKISLTHFSDILRFNLLKNYGGLWTDVTVFWIGNISERYFSNFYTCGGYSDPHYFAVSDGMWTGFLIGGKKSHELFVFMDRFFELYWEKEDKLIDYFLIDYALKYAYDNNIGDIQRYIHEEARKNNTELFNLAKIINEKYDERLISKITENTEAFKLSYKKEYKMGNTFYEKFFCKEN